VARSARKAMLRIYGKGERVREVPIHRQLHRALTGWLTERDGWPGATDTPALFLNQRGQRLGGRSRGRHHRPRPQAHVCNNPRAWGDRPGHRCRTSRALPARNYPWVHPLHRRGPHEST
jgi:hypothetical protein